MTKKLLTEMGLTEEDLLSLTPRERLTHRIDYMTQYPPRNGRRLGFPGALLEIEKSELDSLEIIVTSATGGMRTWARSCTPKEVLEKIRNEDYRVIGE